MEVNETATHLEITLEPGKDDALIAVVASIVAEQGVSPKEALWQLMQRGIDVLRNTYGEMN